MYEYKEKNAPKCKPERRAASRRKFSDTSEPTQLKFADEALHDKLSRRFGANAVIQFKMDAGYGDAWHIHKGHIKYGTNTATRINFNAKDTAATILARLNRVLQTFPGLNGQRGLSECIAWINTYY